MTTTPTTVPDWSDRDLWIICGGPSLRGLDLIGLRDRGRVLGVNRAADFWNVDAVCSIDRVFIRKRWGWLASLARGPIEVHLAHDDSWGFPAVPGSFRYTKSPEPGLSMSHGELRGLNSGFAALDLGVSLGAKTIYLLGLDLLRVAPGKSMHWHDGYQWGNRSSLTNYPRWAKDFDEAAESLPAGVRVVNANPSSAVRAFPFVSYEELGLPRFGAVG